MDVLPRKKRQAAQCNQHFLAARQLAKAEDFRFMVAVVPKKTWL